MTNKFPKIEIEVARYLKKEHDEMVEYFTKIMSYHVPELQDSKIAVWVKTDKHAYRLIVHANWENNRIEVYSKEAIKNDR